MNRIHATVAPLDQLEQILPSLLASLSIGRSQIAVEQLQSAVRGNKEQIILVTAAVETDERSTVDPGPPLAAAIVLQPIDGASGRKSESATVVHAGSLQPMDETTIDRVASPLGIAVDRVLRDRGVQFVQWGTDSQADQPSSIAIWCRALGFDQIAHLDYLAGSIQNGQHDSTSGREKLAEHRISDMPLAFQCLDWTNRDASLKSYAELVERTYIDTLDCPELADFRSSEQTLAGYQQAGSFDPRLWFRIGDSSGQSGDPLGCVILSNHSRGAETKGGETDGGVIELVYMGLVPEARGRGMGRAMLQQSIAIAREMGADRMIMAVDRKNRPAGDIYHDAGFLPILSESVWVKSLKATSR